MRSLFGSPSDLMQTAAVTIAAQIRATLSTRMQGGRRARGGFNAVGDDLLSQCRAANLYRHRDGRVELQQAAGREGADALPDLRGRSRLDEANGVAGGIRHVASARRRRSSGPTPDAVAG